MTVYTVLPANHMVRHGLNIGDNRFTHNIELNEQQREGRLVPAATQTN
jgi:hypothetical protein